MRYLLLPFILMPLLPVPGVAQSGLGAPLAGVARGADGRLEKIWGIAGNLIGRLSGPPEVLSLAFTGTEGLVKSAGELSLLDAQGERTVSWDSPEGPAVLGLDGSGHPALAWFPENRTWWRLGKNGPETLDWTPEGEVVAATENRGRPLAVVRRDDGLWLDGPGRSAEPLGGPEIRTALFMPHGDLLLAAGEELLLRSPDGSETRYPLPLAATALERMGASWIVASSGRDRYAVRLLDGRADCYRLPAGEAAP